MEEKQGTAPDPSEPNTRTEPLYSLASRWFLYLAAAFFLYVLSTGPVLKLAIVSPGFRPYFGPLYAPLIALSKACPPVDRAFKWYLFTIWRVPKP
jgi:hypothetical protein